MKKPRTRRTFRPTLELLETRELLSGAPVWNGYARDPQHTATSAVASQSLDAIHWSTPVDTNKQYSGNDLLIHYGSPMVTEANTVLVPVKTTDGGGNTVFEIRAFNGADGSLLWSQQTDYTLPSAGWTPSYGPTLTPGNRLYYQGIGGQIYYSDNIDQSGAARTGTYVFYGQSNYDQDPATYNSNVKICTPITSDSAGNIYFGFKVLGSTPLGLSSGIARIDTAGNGSYVSASTAAGDGGIICMAFNSAPALSNNGATLYVAVNSGSGGYGYVLALDSTTLATNSKVLLYDPKTGNLGRLDNSGTSSPMVGPDGDVYFGVLENPFASNNARGWLLHFSGDLATLKTPGAFGWDDTPSVVPISMIPDYSGPSTYLLMTKYNNYDGYGTGDGQNRIAILDPNVSFTDPISDVTVMNEVRTILGQTPDQEHPGGVREWCINTAVVDPATNSVLANSEDGKLYRWRIDNNNFTQVITLTAGIGEAYTPTLIGADGTVYAVNDGTLFAVGQTADQITGQISGTLYNDANGNGSQDAGDTGISGRTVYLDADNSGTFDTGETNTTTDANGNYSFDGLADGTYRVRAVSPAGWVQTTASQDVTISANQQVSGVNYGSFQQVSISGIFYNDRNDNHSQDAGEPGISGVTITLDGSAATTTDANGNYTINGVGPGAHTVSEVLPSQYLLTSPTGNAYSITTSSGVNVAGKNFANALPQATSDNGQISYKESGKGWLTLGQGWNGTSRTHAATRTGGIYTTWTLTQFGGLPAGKYEVFVSYLPAADRDTTTNYQVFDNTIKRGTVSVNQTVAPSNGLYQGLQWKSLGTFTFTHGQAKVRLTVAFDGSVDADGALLVPAGSATGPTAGGVDPASIGPAINTSESGKGVVFSPSAILAKAAAVSLGTSVVVAAMPARVADMVFSALAGPPRQRTWDEEFAFWEAGQ